MQPVRNIVRWSSRGGAIAGLAFVFAAGRAMAADVSAYALIKNRLFTQTNASAPVLAVSNAFSFNAVVDAAASNVTSATLRLPSLVTNTFTNLPGISPFAISQVFATQAAMDSNFASGSYQFRINAVHDGTRTPSLSLTGNAYPNAPMVTNFNAAQLVDPGADFTLRWQPMTGGTSQDNIVLTISRAGGAIVLITPIFGQSGALDGTATSYLIPANTLAAGQTYSAALAFGNITAVDLFSYGGLIQVVPGVSVYSSTTDFPMRTRSIPVLTITNLAGNVAQLRFNSDSGRDYELRASSNLMDWFSLLLTNATGDTVTYPDADSPGLPFRYYRVQAP